MLFKKETVVLSLLLSSLCLAFAPTSALASPVWDSGDNHPADQPASPPAPPVKFPEGAREIRTVNLVAEVVQPGDPKTQQGAPGQVNVSANEFSIRDDQSVVINMFGAVADSVLNYGTAHKAGIYVGSMARAVANQSVALAQFAGTYPAPSTFADKRTALTGSATYAGFADVLGNISDPDYFKHGLVNDITASWSFVQLDSTSIVDPQNPGTKYPAVAGQTTGVRVLVDNGTASSGAKGSYAGDVVGVDVEMNSGYVDGNDRTQMASYTGVRINAPGRTKFTHQNGTITPGPLTRSVDDFDNKSYGVLVKPIRPSSQADPDPAGAKYAGIRSESSVEFADKVVYDPVNSSVYVPGPSVVFPVNRALLQLYCPSGSPVILTNPLPAVATPGQQLQIVNVGPGTVIFPDSGSLKLSGSKTLGTYDTLSLVYVKYGTVGYWVQLSFSDN